MLVGDANSSVNLVRPICRLHIFLLAELIFFQERIFIFPNFTLQPSISTFSILTFAMSNCWCAIFLSVYCKSCFCTIGRIKRIFHGVMVRTGKVNVEPGEDFLDLDLALTRTR